MLGVRDLVQVGAVSATLYQDRGSDIDMYCSMAIFIYLCACLWTGAIVASPTSIHELKSSFNGAQDASGASNLLKSSGSMDQNLYARSKDSQSQISDYDFSTDSVQSFSSEEWQQKWLKEWEQIAPELAKMEELITANSTSNGGRTDGSADSDASVGTMDRPRTYRIDIVDQNTIIYIFTYEDFPLDSFSMDLAVLDIYAQLKEDEKAILTEKITSRPKPPDMDTVYAEVCPEANAPKIEKGAVARLLDRLQHYIDLELIFYRLGFVILKDAFLTFGGVISSQPTIEPPEDNDAASGPSLTGSLYFTFKLDDHWVLGVKVDVDADLDGLYIDFALLDIQTQLQKNKQEPLTDKVRGEQGYTVAQIAPLQTGREAVTRGEANRLLEMATRRIDQAQIFYAMKFVITKDKVPSISGFVRITREGDAEKTVTDVSDVPEDLTGPLELTGGELGFPSEVQEVGTGERKGYEFHKDDYKVKIVTRPDIRIAAISLDVTLQGLQIILYRSPTVILDHTVRYRTGAREGNVYTAIAPTDTAYPDNMTYAQANVLLEAMQRYINQEGLHCAQRFWFFRGDKEVAIGVIIPTPPPPTGQTSSY